MIEFTTASIGTGRTGFSAASRSRARSSHSSRQREGRRQSAGQRLRRELVGSVWDAVTVEETLGMVTGLERTEHDEARSTPGSTA